MAKPSVTLRNTKGSALTFTEADNNFTNLRDATITITDGTTPQAIDLNGTVTFTGGVGINVAQSSGTVTITNTGTSDIVNDTSPQLGGSLDVNGNIITSASNGNVTISPDGTGQIVLDRGAGLAILTTPDNTTGLYLTTNLTSNTPTIRINPTSAGTIDIRPGTGGLDIDKVTNFNGVEVTDLQLDNYKEVIYTSGTTTGTITPDVANGNVQKITLTGSITLNAFANAEAGQSMTLVVTQPSSGGPYTLTSTMKFAGGTKTLSTAANAVDIISIFYDGTTYYASLATNFS